MQKFKYLFSIVILIAIVFTGCQKESSIVAPEFSSTASLNKFILPAGATLVSSTLYVHNYAHFNANPINIHRITAPWQEYVVTYNNFGGAYSGTIEDFLSPGGIGNDFRFADVTTLVQSWLNGTNMNYGLLLDEPIYRDELSQYSSRETVADAPYLEVCYSYDGGQTVICDTTRAVADTYIWELPEKADVNFGARDRLFTGYQNNYRKQALLQFDFEVTPPDGGCTLTPGYWKTHSSYGPAPYDATWAQVGEDTPFFLSGQSYYAVLWTSPAGNAYYNLSFHYIAAQLNFLNGASIPAEVQDAFDTATLLFNTYTPAQIAALRGNNATRAQFISLAGILGQYNEGYIGPGHCDDIEPL